MHFILILQALYLLKYLLEKLSSFIKRNNERKVQIQNFFMNLIVIIKGQLQRIRHFAN